MIRGGSRMQESCTYGSVRGAPRNGRPYRNRQIGQRFRGFVRDGAERLRGAAVSSEHLPASPEDRTSDRARPNEEVSEMPVFRLGPF
jgi:hypothetical protein